jgi:hypothetical protein
LKVNALLKKFSGYKAHNVEVYKKNHLKELENLVPIFIIKNLKILELNKIDFKNIQEVKTSIKNNKMIKLQFDNFIEKNYIDNDVLDFEEWSKNQNIKVEKNHL